MNTLALFPLFETGDNVKRGFEPQLQPPLGELIIPLNIVRDAGHEVYSTHSVGSGRAKVNPRGYQEDEELTKDSVELIRQRLADRLETKRLNHSKPKDNTEVFVRSSLAKHKLDTEQQYRVTRRHRSSLIKTPQPSRRRMFKQPDSGEPRLIVAERNEKITKDRSTEKVQISSSESSRQNSTNLENGEQCEPITWFGVFHHSIFGKTKFCGI